MSPRDYIFGYGSLICQHSRSLTATQSRGGEAVVVVATPVLVRGLERVWSVRAPAFCAMGVQFRPHAECVGVLVPVPVHSSEELARLDERELGYQRVLLDRNNVVRVPFLLDDQDDNDHYYSCEKHNAVFSSGSCSDGVINIWCYVQEEEWNSPPTAESPLVQSYIDTILRGCLDYNEEFAVSFIQKTAGWKTPHYVDDRHRPIYPRGDPEWSRQHASRLDDLLHKHLKDWFHCRKPR